MLDTPDLYRGTKLEQVAQDLEKLLHDFERFRENHQYFEHIEMRVEILKQKYRKLFEAQDDGSMPQEVQTLIGLVQEFENGRR